MKFTTTEIVFGLIGLFVVVHTLGVQKAVVSNALAGTTPESVTGTVSAGLLPYVDATSYSVTGA